MQGLGFGTGHATIVVPLLKVSRCVRFVEGGLGTAGGSLRVFLGADELAGDVTRGRPHGLFSRPWSPSLSPYFV